MKYGRGKNPNSHGNNSQALKLKWKDPEWRANQIEKHKEYFVRHPEERNRVVGVTTSESCSLGGQRGAAALRRKSKSERKAISTKIGKSCSLLWQDLGYKARMSAKRKKRAKDPTFRKKMSCIRKQYFREHPEERDRISARVSEEMKQRVKTSEWQEQVARQGKANSAHVKRHWTDPVARKRHIKSLKRAAAVRKPSSGGDRWPFQQGWLKTKKAGRIFCRSSWESALAILLEESSHVEKFSVEPYSIKYKFQGVEHAYWPDFWIQFKNGQEFLVEIKGGWRRESKAKTLAKTKAAIDYCHANGMEFELFTEKVQSLSSFIQ